MWTVEDWTYVGVVIAMFVIRGRPFVEFTVEKVSSKLASISEGHLAGTVQITSDDLTRVRSTTVDFHILGRSLVKFIVDKDTVPLFSAREC